MGCDVDDVAAWFLALYKATGIKLTIFYDGFDRQRFVWGFLTSVRLMAICLVASVVIGTTIGNSPSQPRGRRVCSILSATPAWRSSGGGARQGAVWRALQLLPRLGCPRRRIPTMGLNVVAWRKYCFFNWIAD